MAFHFGIHAIAAYCKDKKSTVTSISVKSKPNITYPSEVLVASNAGLSRTPRQTKFMLENAPLNFPVYALRDIKSYRVCLLISLCHGD